MQECLKIRCLALSGLAARASRDLGPVMKHSRFLCADGSGQTQPMYPKTKEVWLYAAVPEMIHPASQLVC